MIIIDRKTFSTYGWSVVVVIVLIVLTLLASPFAMYIRTSIRALHFSVSNEAGKELNAFSAESYVLPTNYTAEEIEQIPTVFAIGKNNPINVIARFNSNFTECTIIKNTENADGLMMDFVNTDANKMSPMYKYRNSLETVSIEYGVENIGANAFVNSNKLKNITIHSTVTMFPENALPGWNNSAKSLTLYYNGAADYTQFRKVIKTLIIANGMTEVPESEFYETDTANRWLFKELIISPSVTKINGQAFRNCVGLESVTLPNNLSYIGEYAFQNDVKLTNIILPDNLSYIGEYAFHSCTSLQKIDIPAKIKTIPRGCFQNCSKLINITFPNGLKEIEPRAFSNCKIIETFHIPDSVLNIREYAFSYCYGLREINLPPKITLIDKYLFYSCSSLEHINIPDKVTKIDNSAFGKCSSLLDITFPDSCSFLADNSFKECTSLTNIYFPNSVNTISYQSFFGCTSLQSVSLPKDIVIGNYVFGNCGNLNDITFRGAPSSVEHSAFTGINESGTQLYKGCGLYYDENAWIDNVFYVDNVAVWCRVDVGEIYEIRPGTRHICRETFALSKNIKELTIPESLESTTPVVGTTAQNRRWPINPYNLEKIYCYRNSPGRAYAGSLKGWAKPDAVIIYLDD